MNLINCYHSFLVRLFVEETRVLAAGVSITDVTGSVGFCPDVCTLACGVIGDGLPKSITLELIQKEVESNLSVLALSSLL
ncbi:Cleavage/polyadenylation specificity factor, A subunit, C-terminal [Artemisia annua]|uniref:Cleavage/polyadenylation specificity factor, A subunit, C-terminal n=1 Tax=Artemisia annua TaxID=35608 RepID=A0A2U1L0R1_ARTAN|nr:Cleavage/polyadenylation specificity factor, A subunit, C-terminal [Artemisia annua]